MALSAWQATIVNESGDVIPSASIEVVNEATGLTATIYANAGGGSLGNPFPADTNGFARFYADAGSYTIIASDAGSGFSESFNNVRLGNAQGYDVGSGSGEIPRNTDLGTAAQADTGTAAGHVPTNADLGTASTKDTGTAAGQVPTNADLGTASTKDTGTAAGQVPTADQLSMVGETINYTGANYQPNIYGGIGVVMMCNNASGGSISPLASIAGSQLRSLYFNASGNLSSLAALSGTWLNISGRTLLANESSLLVRTA